MDSQSLKATQIAMGPWFVRDAANPFRPGCSYPVLKQQIEAGRIRPNTIIRGPTTHQFWSVARNVRGVSHLVGYCHRCGERIKPTEFSCPRCQAPFAPFTDRNRIGIRYPTDAEAEAAEQELAIQIRTQRTGDGHVHEPGATTTVESESGGVGSGLGTLAWRPRPAELLDVDQELDLLIDEQPPAPQPAELESLAKAVGDMTNPPSNPVRDAASLEAGPVTTDGSIESTAAADPRPPRFGPGLWLLLGLNLAAAAAVAALLWVNWK